MCFKWWINGKLIRLAFMLRLIKRKLSLLFLCGVGENHAMNYYHKTIVDSTNPNLYVRTHTPSVQCFLYIIYFHLQSFILLVEQEATTINKLWIKRCAATAALVAIVVPFFHTFYYLWIESMNKSIAYNNKASNNYIRRTAYCGWLAGGMNE